MEILMSISRVLGIWGVAYALIYITAILTKGILIFTGSAKPEELKDWFDFFKKKKDTL